MNIESPEFKKDDRTRFVVRLYLYLDCKNIKYRIYDIMYCEHRKRTWKSLESSFRDSWDYRQLDQKERRIYEIRKYIEFVGKEKLEEAIIQAWENMKPNIEEILL